VGVAASRERTRQLCRDAREAVQPFGEAAAPLCALASYVLERDH